MPLSLTSSVNAIGTGLTASFLAVGGTSPYTYSVVAGGAGGTINSSTGVYTSPSSINPDVSKSYDTIRVQDAAFGLATKQILVGTPLILLCDILQRQLSLDNNHIYLWDQKLFQPVDSGLYLAIGVVSSKPFGNTNRFRGSSGTSQQSINMLDTISIDAISRGPAARDQKGLILLALNSDYAESQQELNSFFIGKLPLNGRFQNLSEIDGAAIPYRFRIEVTLQYFVTNVQSVQYYDEFEDVEVTTDA